MRTPSENILGSLLSELQQPVDLYIHFPFCRSMGAYECTFCHFYKEMYDQRLEESYIAMCQKELQIYKQHLHDIKVSSIYFGGGSFSLISPNSLKHLLDFLKSELDIKECEEIRFEIHADASKTPDRTKKLLSSLREFGVTHIVIDIQTFNKESLFAITWRRVHPEDYFSTLEIGKEC